jgi:hypothetical protein
MRSASVLLAALALAFGGCSVVIELDDYDAAVGAGGSNAATGGTGTPVSSGTGLTSSTSSVSGGGGAPPCGNGELLPAALFQEPFDEGAPATFVGCGSQTGGVLHFDLPASGDLWCVSQSVDAYCLTTSSITMKVPQAATAPIPGLQTWIILDEVGSTGSFTVLLEANAFGLGGGKDGNSVSIPIQSYSYDEFQNVWWRLAGEDGQIVFSTSTDGLAWGERGRGDPVMSLDAVRITIGANRYYNPEHPGSANLPADSTVFDCLNMPGACP